MDTRYRHDIFLSHSTRTNTADAEDFVVAVKNSLQARGIRVFLDLISVTAEGRALTVLEQEMQASRAGVVFWDNHAVRSSWVDLEMGILRERRASLEMKACIAIREPGLVPPPGFSDLEILSYVEGELPSQLAGRILNCLGN